MGGQLFPELAYHFGSRLDFGYIDLSPAHATDAPRTGRSHLFAGRLAGSLHPGGELSFVELVVLVDVEVAHFLLLGLAGSIGQ